VCFVDADAFFVDSAVGVFDIAGDVVAEEGILGKAANAPTFNAGFMVVSPSLAMMDALVNRGKQDPPKLFGNSLDCTEQGLLNGYFYENPHLTSTKLRIHRSFGDDGDPKNRERLPVGHFITLNCPKPWSIDAEDIVRLPDACNKELYVMWQAIAAHVDYGLSLDRSEVASALQNMTAQPKPAFVPKGVFAKKQTKTPSEATT